MDRWLSGEKETALVDLRNIDRVPVTIFMPTSDSICPSTKAEEHFELISSEKYLVWQYGDHGVFPELRSDAFMDRLEEIINTGNTTSVLTAGASQLTNAISIALVALTLIIPF